MLTVMQLVMPGWGTVPFNAGLYVPSSSHLQTFIDSSKVSVYVVQAQYSRTGQANDNQPALMLLGGANEDPSGIYPPVNPILRPHMYAGWNARVALYPVQGVSRLLIIVSNQVNSLECGNR
jgi:hypothetical protein